MSKLTTFQQYVHKSRYARWIPEKNRRENWDETVQRYVDFISPRIPEDVREATAEELRNAILNMEVMPSMRALMTAGPAGEKDNVALYNCSYIAVDDIRAFDEAMYILMCFHPDTLVRTPGGATKISDLRPGDLVLSKDDCGFYYQPVEEVLCNSTEQSPKLELEFEDGSKIICTENHEFLTQRGYIKASELLDADEIVCESNKIYVVENKQNGKKYVGKTSKTVEARFRQHVNEARARAQTPFHKAINKYGAENFSVCEVENGLTAEQAEKRESFWIKELDSYGSAGYNCTLGGEGASGYRWTENQKENRPSRTVTAEERAARSLKMREYNASRIFTEDYRKKLSDSQAGERNHRFGIAMPEEIKEKLSAANTGTGNPFFGKRHSPQTKELLSEKNKGRFSGGRNPAARPVFVGGLHFGSLREAQNFLGITRNSLLEKVTTGEAFYENR